MGSLSYCTKELIYNIFEIMNLDIKKYWNWKKKILFAFPILMDINSLCKKKDLTVYELNPAVLNSMFYRNFMGFITPSKYKQSYEKNSEIIKYYDLIEEFIKENKIKYVHSPVIFFYKDFMKKLKKKYWCVFSTQLRDEPDTSHIYSRPNVKNFDKAISWAVYADENTLVTETFKRYWAKDVRFIHVYPTPSHYDDRPIDYAKKDIDLIYVWAVNLKKMPRISKLKKHFKDRMHLYGHFWNWDWKSISGIIYKFFNWFYGIWYIKKLTDEELKDIYKRAKIWVNVHLTYWPSNARSYEIALNWVMQIADNPKWYSTLYKLSKEIVCFQNNDIQDAIQKIEYYLQNDKQREQIAQAWYKKAWQEYSYDKWIQKTLTYITK